MDTALTLDFAPLVPPALIAGLTALALAAALLGAVRRLNGWIWRSAAALALAAALANPSLVNEEREALTDIAVLVVDRSGSMEIGARAEAAETMRARLQAQATGDPTLEIVEAEIGASPDGTLAFDALAAALAAAPRDRLAGIVIASDGQIHDAPENLDALGLEAPLHAVVTGDPNAGDRRLVVVEAPRYGMVGDPARFTIRVEDSAMTGSAQVTFRLDGGPAVTARIPIGEDTAVDVEIAHRGPNVVEIEAAPGPEELSLDNNRAAVSVSGVRDRLRVLLVTGEPHNGARAWRDLLKSDPSVDLVHFTILRPPEKQDGTPIDELALIAFPTRELFAERLDEFDLVIFDRYRRRAIMPLLYFDYIARYVENGGALLLTAGPPFAYPVSIHRTPLAAVIPARPTGEIMEGGFRPRPTELGRRHPVTASLSDGASDPEWGRWFRRIDAVASGETLIEAPDGGPLLVLSREGEGRAAVVLSDQTWLWERGFEGGGPYAEMFRRVAHWLMQEPDLDEERLAAAVDADGVLQIERTTLADSAPPLEITWPDASVQNVEMSPTDASGRYIAAAETSQTGLARLRSGDLTTVAALGPLNPREYSDLRATGAVLRPFAQATGGGVYMVNEGDALALPSIRRTRPGSDHAGRGWLGLQRNERYVVRGAERTPLLPALLVVLLAIGFLGLGWRREGK